MRRLLISVAAAPLLWAGTALAQPAAAQLSSPSQLVDALNGVFGKQTYARAVHAKGIVLQGRFTPDAAASSLSRAAHLQGTGVPVTVRFSDFAGIPTVSDTDGLATPRGMAIKFHLPDGSETDLVTHSFNGFPTATADEFRELLNAIAASGPGAPVPTPADAFMASHPIAKAFFANATPPPVSYATLAYYGVNSFKFTNASGVDRFGRYQLVPGAGVHFLSKDELAKAGPGYLADEIRRRVASGPVRFTFQVQLSGEGDRIDDPSVAWPESRPVVVLGIIEITAVDRDSGTAERALLFSPTALVDGIVPADPMINARGASYGVSYGRRHE